MRWIGLLAVILLIYACFNPWVTIHSKNIIVSGIDAEGTNFGKPAYLHFVFGFFFTLFHLIPRLWAKRWNILVVALNIAWAVRNFFVISSCREGDCPVKQMGLYLMLAASLIMLVAALFPDIELKDDEKV
jgi:hypothetical protein